MTLSCHLYYDATVAVALSTAFALVVALIAAVIVGGSAPDLSVAIVAFVLVGAIQLLRLDWRGQSSPFAN